MAMPELCYRALLYEGQRQRWINGVYNSYHPATHPFWQGIWNRKEHANPGADHDANDFPLAFAAGRYSEAARTKFLQLMREKGDDIWTQAEIDSASELDGVCSFNGEEGAQLAYEYAATSGLPEHVARIVTFMGDYVCDLPEGGGVQARVVEVIGPPVTAAAFRVQHGLQQYVPPGA
jgi:hypothetical protein